MGACNENGVKVYSTPPTVAILEPADGAGFYEGQTVTFRGQVTTADGSSLEGHTHQWVAGSDTICQQAEVDESTGFIECAYVFTDEGTYAVTVTATNDRGDIGTASISVDIGYNAAPTVELIAPQDNDVLQSTDLVVFEALIADTEDEADELTVRINSSQDGDLSVPTQGTTSGDYSGAASLTAGPHLLTITVTDTAGKSAQDTATVRVNDAPSAPVVEIYPENPVSGEGLQASIITPSVDPEGDTVTYRYDWHVDGDATPYSSGTNPTLTDGVTLRGEYWEVRVYPYDGAAWGNAGIDAVSIGNQVPSIQSVAFNPTNPDTVADVVAVPQNFFDPEGDAEAYHYVWYHNGTLETSETTDTFPSSRTIKGDTLRVEVTPYDDYGDGVMVSSVTVEIANSVPTQPGVTIAPGGPEPEDDLICSVAGPSVDNDGDTITYDYEWLVNGVSSGILSYFVDAAQTAHNDLWECRVTPYDGEDYGTYGSAQVTVTDQSAPNAPYISAVDRYRNDVDVDLTGTCEANCSLTFYLSDSTGSWSETNTCGANGTFTHTTYVTRGYATSAYATCTDSANNTSTASNTVTTEACDPEDTYENTSGYGDSGANAINEWGTFTDANSQGTIQVTGTALNTADEDWYVFQASDNQATDIANGYNNFNFEVALSHGSSTYSFFVYRDGHAQANLTCNTDPSGYTEFSWDQEDQQDHSSGSWHLVSSNDRTCSASGSRYNTCSDFTGAYYVKVVRNSSASDSCEYYTLDVSNGQ